MGVEELFLSSILHVVSFGTLPLDYTPTAGRESKEGSWHNSTYAKFQKKNVRMKTEKLQENPEIADETIQKDDIILILSDTCRICDTNPTPKLRMLVSRTGTICTFLKMKENEQTRIKSVSGMDSWHL